jgi:hypothetical protein
MDHPERVMGGCGGDKSGVQRVSLEVSAEQKYLSLCCQERQCGRNCQ